MRRLGRVRASSCLICREAFKLNSGHHIINATLFNARIPRDMELLIEGPQMPEYYDGDRIAEVDILHTPGEWTKVIPRRTQPDTSPIVVCTKGQLRQTLIDARVRAETADAICEKMTRGQSEEGA